MKEVNLEQAGVGKARNVNIPGMCVLSSLKVQIVPSRYRACFPSINLHLTFSVLPLVSRSCHFGSHCLSQGYDKLRGHHGGHIRNDQVHVAVFTRCFLV